MSDINPEDVGKAIFTERYAVLARTGLSVAAIDSWDEQLARDSRLLVPIDVQALVIDAGGGGEAVPTETVLPIVDEGDTEGVLPVPPAPFGKPFERAPGVHLHWAMPDGLTRGDAGAVSETAPPRGQPDGAAVAARPLGDRARRPRARRTCRRGCWRPTAAIATTLPGGRSPGRRPRAPSPGPPAAA